MARDAKGDLAVDKTVNVEQGFSVELWAKPNQLRIQGLVYKDFVSSWRLFMSDTSGHVEFDALQDTWDCFTTGSDTLPVGSYTHVVATYDKTKQEMRIYLNGSLRATCGGVTNMGGSFNAPLLLGYLNLTNWSGSLDEPAYYNYALSAAAVKAHYGDASTYSYDSLYRLTGTTYPNGDSQSYTYDPLGNRLTKVNNGVTTNYTYDNADQMTAAGGVTYGYDNNGNQTSRGADTFGYNAENRLTSTNLAGVAGSYGYNGDGLRMSRTIGGTGVSYAWSVSGSLPGILQDSGGNKYVYGLGLISRTDSTGAQEYYLSDGLGSTTGLANGAGTVTGSYAYDVFGAIRQQTGTSPNEFTYTREQNDPSGLEYLRARYFDSATGRLLVRDPLPLLQRYPYVRNNPVNMVDPSGTCHSPAYPYPHPNTLAYGVGPAPSATPPPPSAAPIWGEKMPEGLRGPYGSCQTPEEIGIPTGGLGIVGVIGNGWGWSCNHSWGFGDVICHPNEVVSGPKSAFQWLTSRSKTCYQTIVLTLIAVYTAPEYTIANAPYILEQLGTSCSQ